MEREKSGPSDLPSRDVEIDSVLKITVTANKNNDGIKIPYPPEVQERVSESRPRGEYVYWHYDEEYGHVTLTDASLRENQYQQLGDTTIYDGGEIRPPENQELPLLKLINPGDRIQYYAHSGMCGGEVSSVWLLWGEQHLDILGNEERRQQLSQVPNFLRKNIFVTD